MDILNIVKWELRKIILRLNFVFTVYIVALFLVYVITDALIYGASNLPTSIAVLSIIVTMLLFSAGGYLMLMMPTHVVITEMRSHYSVLEKMRGGSFMATAIVRIIVNMLFVLLCYGLLVMVRRLLMGHGVEEDVLTRSYFLPTAELLFYTVIVSPIVAMFAVIAGTSIPKRKGLSLVVALALYLIAGAVIFLIWNSSLPVIASLIIQGAVVVLLFVASCWLYDNKWEIAA